MIDRPGLGAGAGGPGSGSWTTGPGRAEHDDGNDRDGGGRPRARARFDRGLRRPAGGASAPLTGRRLPRALLGHHLHGGAGPGHRGEHRRPLDERVRRVRPLRQRGVRPPCSAGREGLDLLHRHVLRAAAGALHPDPGPARAGGQRLRAPGGPRPHDRRRHRRPVLRRPVHRPVPVDLRRQRGGRGPSTWVACATSGSRRAASPSSAPSAP